MVRLKLVFCPELEYSLDIFELKVVRVHSPDVLHGGYFKQSVWLEVLAELYDVLDILRLLVIDKVAAVGNDLAVP